MMGLEEPLKDTRTLGVTFTCGDESNMKARGSRGTSHSSMCADQAAALKSFLFLYPFLTHKAFMQTASKKRVLHRMLMLWCL